MDWSQELVLHRRQVAVWNGFANGYRNHSSICISIVHNLVDSKSAVCQANRFPVQGINNKEVM